MFYLIELHKQIQIEPKYFGRDLKEQVDKKLRSEVEGTSSEMFGFVVAVISCRLDDLPGFLRDRDGTAMYNVPYTAIVFKPEKGQVVEGVVEACVKNGIYVDVGPLRVYISDSNIPRSYRFEPQPPSFVYTGEGGVEEARPRIEQEGLIRLRILGLRESRNPNDYTAVGTIRDDFLGPLAS